MKGTPEMNSNNKPFVILAAAIAALFAISFVVRFVVLSDLGVSTGWMLMFCLPAGGIGLLIVLLRIGLLNSGSQSFGATTPARPARWTPEPTVAPTTKRLQDIENLRASGAISDDEYTAERARIIASL
jgi:hypothetical protein